MRVLQSLLLVCSFVTLARADLLIKNVTVIDVKTGSEIAHQSVLIHGSSIVAIGSHVPAPKSATLVDGSGRFLIPGLWDMHVHLWHRENQFPLFLANGITGVRDMGSDLNWINHWRDQMKAGKLLGPHIQTPGPAVNGAPSDDPKLPILVVRGPNDARSTFDRLDDMNVDFVKVLSGVPRDAYFALIERARKYYLPVAGHVPDSITLLEAIDARQKSVEHMTGVLIACSDREEKLRSRRFLALEKKDTRSYYEVEAEIIKTYDPRKAVELFERMARYEMREVPSLIMLRRSMFADAEALAVDPRLRFISTKIRHDWTDPRADKKEVPREVLSLLEARYARNCEALLQMKRSGVAIMAGTDTGDPYSFPGFDLHRELELLVEAGFTPLQALQSATIEPARYFDAEDVTGSIAKGKSADLVLLDADPLKNISNVERIDAVFLNGRYLSKSHLRSMLQSAK